MAEPDQKIAEPEWLIPLVDQDFGGQWSKLWRQAFAHGKVNPHSVWEFCAKRVVNGKVCIIGDCAHMASPNTGAGAHSAMLDAVALGETYAECKGNIDATLKAYNPKGVA